MDGLMKIAFHNEALVQLFISKIQQLETNTCWIGKLLNNLKSKHISEDNFISPLRKDMQAIILQFFSELVFAEVIARLENTQWDLGTNIRP